MEDKGVWSQIWGPDSQSSKQDAQPLLYLSLPSQGKLATQKDTSFGETGV
jgi:hypothetical protein